MKIGIAPLRNFAVVEDEKLYRSAQPIFNYEFAWIKNTLGVKTIVNLRAESDIDSRRAPEGLNVVNIRVKDHFIPTSDQVQAFIDTLKDESNYPILFHCEHGHGRTSTFCVLARMIMGWTYEQAMSEEENDFNYHFKYEPQIKFLKEIFDKQ